MELSEVLVWIISGGGAPFLAYWLIERVRKLAELAPEAKRYVAYGLAAGLGILAYAGGVVLGFEASPVGWLGWINQLVFVALLASGVNQFIHAKLQLGKKRR